jgi:hypothetical protein
LMPVALVGYIINADRCSSAIQRGVLRRSIDFAHGQCRVFRKEGFP